MSIKHPKGRQLGTFYWFIGDCLILARCREIPTSLIWRIQCKNTIWRAGKKGFMGEDGYRRGI